MDIQSKNQLDQIRQLQEQVKDFERLSKVVESVGSAVRVEDTIKHILEETIEICNADQGSIFLFSPGEEHTAKTLIREGASTEQKLDHFLNNLLGGWVLVNKRPLLTSNLQEIFGTQDIKPKYADINSVLSVPLVLQGKRIRVINLISQRREQKFCKRDIHFNND